jgi:MscS family membrane protein
MNAFRKISPLVLCLALSLSSSAQITQILQGAEGQKEKPAPSDPLGRQTPNGTLFGFLQAMQAGNKQTATQYLQMSPTEGPARRRVRRQPEGDQRKP